MEPIHSSNIHYQHPLNSDQVPCNVHPMSNMVSSYQENSSFNGPNVNHRLNCQQISSTFQFHPDSLSNALSLDPALNFSLEKTSHFPKISIENPLDLNLDNNSFSGIATKYSAKHNIPIEKTPSTSTAAVEYGENIQKFSEIPENSQCKLQQASNDYSSPKVVSFEKRNDILMPYTFSNTLVSHKELDSSVSQHQKYDHSSLEFHDDNIDILVQHNSLGFQMSKFPDKLPYTDAQQLTKSLQNVENSLDLVSAELSKVIASSPYRDSFIKKFDSEASFIKSTRKALQDNLISSKSKDVSMCDIYISDIQSTGSIPNDAKQLFGDHDRNPENCSGLQTTLPYRQNNTCVDETRQPKTTNQRTNNRHPFQNSPRLISSAGIKDNKPADPLSFSFQIPARQKFEPNLDSHSSDAANAHFVEMTSKTITNNHPNQGIPVNSIPDLQKLTDQTNLDRKMVDFAIAGTPSEPFSGNYLLQNDEQNALFGTKNSKNCFPSIKTQGGQFQPKLKESVYIPRGNSKYQCQQLREDIHGGIPTKDQKFPTKAYNKPYSSSQGRRKSKTSNTTGVDSPVVNTYYSDIRNDRAIDSMEIPQYRMSREISTLPQMVQEWYEGLDGGPSIRQLEIKYGSKWRTKNDAERVFLGRRKTIIRKIEESIRASNGKRTFDEIVDEMEEERKRLKKSIDGLGRYYNQIAIKEKKTLASQRQEITQKAAVPAMN